jgi:hypothetical protein
VMEAATKYVPKVPVNTYLRCTLVNKNAVLPLQMLLPLYSHSNPPQSIDFCRP